MPGSSPISRRNLHTFLIVPGDHMIVCSLNVELKGVATAFK
jgi:hypothetical protein